MLNIKSVFFESLLISKEYIVPSFFLISITSKKDTTLLINKPAIINVARELEKKGVEVSYVKPNTNGVINSENIK